MHIKTGIAALAIGITASLPTVAQTTPPAAAGSRQTIPEKQSDTPIQGRSESLSSRLNATDGVIKPDANVDPGMRVPAPAPHPDSMPVIPPSATGGNNAK